MADTGSGVRRADATTIVTFPFRYGLVAHHVYALAEIEMGIIADGAPRIVRPARMSSGAARSGMGQETVDTVAADMSVAGYLVAGVRGDVGAVALSAELAAGGRGYNNSAEQLGGPWRGLVEGRVRGERMVTEHVGIGAWVGTSILGSR
ncbi:MAG TPA: hypothetical protein VFV99_20000, partial [Kofleriaceae bacterium]|nr:hypothetical protein [Kofleriaceae bacterium]